MSPDNSFVAKFIGSANIISCKWVKDDSQDTMTVNTYGEAVEIAKKDRKSDKGLLAVFLCRMILYIVLLQVFLGMLVVFFLELV